MKRFLGLVAWMNAVLLVYGFLEAVGGYASDYVMAGMCVNGLGLFFSVLGWVREDCRNAR